MAIGLHGGAKHCTCWTTHREFAAQNIEAHGFKFVPKNNFILFDDFCKPVLVFKIIPYL